MINEVEGIAVLNRSDSRLFVLCHYPDGKKNLITIPVRPLGTQEPASAWTYDIQGDVIHVSQSLKVSTSGPSVEHPKAPPSVEVFHNSGQWSVPFEEFTGEDPTGLTKSPFSTAYDLFRSLNPEYDPSKI